MKRVSVMALAAGAATLVGAGAASAKDYLGVKCESPPPAHCNAEACSPLLGDPGNVVDPKTGRKFWLAGHSKGGGTSHRIVCSDFFKDKVDGLLSLSGGRVGRAEINPRFGPPKADGSPPDPRPAGTGPGGTALGAAPLPTCQFSHIFETGEHEIVSLPATSPLADQWGCATPVEEKDGAEDHPGYAWDYPPQANPARG